MIHLNVALLSGIRVVRDDVERPLTSRRQRAVVAALALRPHAAVGVDELVDALWGEAPPDGARATLQTYVSRLRRAIGNDAVVYEPGGYRLAEGTWCDADEARRLAHAARAALVSDPEQAGDLARRALHLWKGPALGELAHDSWFLPAAVGLKELHANIIEIAAAALMASGRPEQAVELLEPATRTDALREPAHVLLVDALRVSGRNVEALRVADRYRRLLRDETGLVPGTALEAAEHRALAAERDEESPDQADRPFAPPGHLAHGASGLSQVTRLIGRDTELEVLAGWLTSSRLVTICGPGGVGKTTLAAALAERLASTTRVISVPLVPVEMGEVAAAVAAALSLRSDRASAPAITEHLRGTSAVLVVDNAEHVAGEVRQLVRTLLSGAPGVRIVVTSRARLELPEERLYVLPPLAVEGEDAPAVELFLERLQRAGGVPPSPSDPGVRDICTRLDGLPLALELAAGRAAVLGVGGLQDRLEIALDLVATSATGDRHSSLRRVVTWSYDLLDVPERRLLVALAAFDGEFDLDAAEYVGAAVLDRPVSLVLARLVDASLVTPAAGASRYRLLEMVRRFARERLMHEDEYAARWAHTRWVAARLSSLTSAIGASEHEIQVRLEDLRAEVRGAIRWARATVDRDAASALIRPLAHVLQYRPDVELVGAAHSLGRHVLNNAPPTSMPTAGFAAASARLALHAGQLDEVPELVLLGMEAANGDRAALHCARHAQGVLGLYHGHHDDAASSFAAALEAAESIGERLDAMAGMALAKCYAGRIEDARSIGEELRATAATFGSDTYLAFADYVEGEACLASGRVDDAADHLRVATERAWGVGATFISGIAATVLAAVVVRHRPATEARDHLLVLLERWRSTASWTQLWTTLRLTSEFLAQRGHHDLAALIVAAARRDRAAPRIIGDDLARAEALTDRLRIHLGESAYAGIMASAARIERMDVLERVVDALRDLDLC